jgi:hypothetical protein
LTSKNFDDRIPVIKAMTKRDVSDNLKRDGGWCEPLVKGNGL